MIIKKIIRTAGLVLILFTVVVSCSKDDQDPDYTYFVSKELSVVYTRSNISDMITLAAGSIPEVTVLKPLLYPRC